LLRRNFCPFLLDFVPAEAALAASEILMFVFNNRRARFSHLTPTLMPSQKLGAGCLHTFNGWLVSTGTDT